MKYSKTTILVCVWGKKCPKRGSEEVCSRLRKEVEEQELEDKISIKRSDCLDLCKNGPVLVVKPGGVEYGQVQVEDCSEIVQAHSTGDSPIDRLLLGKKKKKKHKHKK